MFEKGDVQDIQVEFKIRNNLILTKMREQRISTVIELCRQMGSPGRQLSVGKLLNMTLTAKTKGGEWRKLCP